MHRIIINNRHITILSLIFASIAFLSSLGWVFENRILIEVNFASTMVFILSSFVLLIFNGSTLYDKKNLILMLVFLLIPIIGFGVQSLFLTSPLILLVTSIISDIGILIVYTIKYSNKSRKILLDIFKLLWVYLLCITHLTSFIFKLQHWPYQNEISNLAGIGYIPLIIVFYVDGFKNKYLLSKTSNNTN